MPVVEACAVEGVGASGLDFAVAELDEVFGEEAGEDVSAGRVEVAVVFEDERVLGRGVAAFQDILAAECFGEVPGVDVDPVGGAGGEAGVGFAVDDADEDGLVINASVFAFGGWRGWWWFGCGFGFGSGLGELEVLGGGEEGFEVEVAGFFEGGVVAGEGRGPGGGGDGEGLEALVKGFVFVFGGEELGVGEGVGVAQVLEWFGLWCGEHYEDECEGRVCGAGLGRGAK